MESLEEVEEERRLCYVGITRAQERLFLSHARQRMLYGNIQVNPVSRFLEEIPRELVEEFVDEEWDIFIFSYISAKGWPRQRRGIWHIFGETIVEFINRW